MEEDGDGGREVAIIHHRNQQQVAPASSTSTAWMNVDFAVHGFTVRQNSGTFNGLRLQLQWSRLHQKNDNIGYDYRSPNLQDVGLQCFPFRRNPLWWHRPGGLRP